MQHDLYIGTHHVMKEKKNEKKRMDWFNNRHGYIAVQYNTVKYTTVQYSTVQYSDTNWPWCQGNQNTFETLSPYTLLVQKILKFNPLSYGIFYHKLTLVYTIDNFKQKYLKLPYVVGKSKFWAHFYFFNLYSWRTKYPQNLKCPIKTLFFTT